MSDLVERLRLADSARRLAWNEYQAAYLRWERAKDAVVQELERRADEEGIAA